MHADARAPVCVFVFIREANWRANACEMPIQVEDLCLEILAENPSQYIDLKNATLVQSMNGQEDVAGILEVCL